MFEDEIVGDNVGEPCRGADHEFAALDRHFTQVGDGLEVDEQDIAAVGVNAILQRAEDVGAAGERDRFPVRPTEQLESIPNRGGGCVANLAHWAPSFVGEARRGSVSPFASAADRVPLRHPERAEPSASPPIRPIARSTLSGVIGSSSMRTPIAL